MRRSTPLEPNNGGVQEEPNLTVVATEEMTSALAALEATAAELGAQSTAEASTLRRLSQKAADALAIAEAKRAEASGTKDKAAKVQLEEEAEAEDAKAAELEAERAAAEAKHEEVESKYQEARVALQTLHIKLTSEKLIDEGRSETTAFREIFSEVDAGISQVLSDHARFGGEMRRLERETKRAEEKEELLALRDLVDPDFYKDEYVAYHIHTRPGKDMRIGSCPPFFGDPKPTPGFKRPEHTAPPPYGKGLFSIAAHRVCDRVTLDAGTPRAASVAIHRIEFGDKALPPGPLQPNKAHEAVYLVQCDSTTTTWARGKPFWVNEHRLKKVKHGHDPHTRAVHKAAWSRLWSRNISFEYAREKAMRELEKQVEIERKLQNGDLDPRHALARPRHPVPLRYHERPVGAANAALRHHHAAREEYRQKLYERQREQLEREEREEEELRQKQPRLLTPREWQQQQQQRQLDGLLTPRPPQHTPRAGGGAGRSRPASARAPVQADAGGYTSLATPRSPSPPGGRVLAPAGLPDHCLPSGRPRPGSAVRPAAAGRVPVRPFSAAVPDAGRTPHHHQQQQHEEAGQEQGEPQPHAQTARKKAPVAFQEQQQVPRLPMPVRGGGASSGRSAPRPQSARY